MDGKRLHHDDHAETSPYPTKRQRTFPNDLNNTIHEPQNTSPSHDDYTIAWICALHIEMAAAQAMLDEIHEDLPRYANDSITYTLGSVKEHNIVIACLPTAQYGTNNAANVLTHLIRTFPSIRLGLMVGIGGGVPSMADIRLGDIVVGTRVMQCDLGKIVGDGQIWRTAIPRILQHQVGTLVSTLRSAHEREPSRVPSILRERLEGLPGYGRPSLPDSLFHASYDHVSSTPSCGGCDESELVPRTTRGSDDPLIHYGAIASGNQVMRSGTARDDIARQLDVLCFEMEAAGLMDILPCLPIRGICDYSDSHKNKEWQRYAAATAAAYARELLSVLSVTETQAKATYMPNSHRDSSNDHRRRLLDSLRFDQIDARKSTINLPYSKTCRWFLNHPDYRAWLDPGGLEQHRGFLWISGKPGAGKSTIMKFIYLSMKKKDRPQHAITASFFFNARGDYLEKSILGMYRSLLHQLLERYPDLQAVLDHPDLTPHSQDGCPSLSVLKDLFRNAVFALGQRSFTCFIDALDECDEQQVADMVQYFEELVEHYTKGTLLRICFSSRHYPHIKLQQGIRLTLEDQPGHAEDLENYIGSRLRINDPALVEELRPQLVEKAAGVFLWVVLVVEILNKEYRQGGLALQKRLAEIPSRLSELFKDILRRDNENMEHLLLCILWILYSKRPLRPEEFYHALWSGLSLKDLADSDIPTVSGPDASGCIERCVISSSKGLAGITKSKQQPTVQLIHENVRDFLIKDKGLHELWPDIGFDWEIPSHERLKQCCSAYIDDHLARLSMVNSDEQGELSKQFPFLEYASCHVLYHADAAASGIPQGEFLTKFSTSDWITIINRFEKYKARQYTPDASLLYILADKGFAELIRTQPKKQPCAYIPRERYRYPLFAALANGHKHAVAALLDLPSSIYNGVDIADGLTCRKDFTEYKNRTPLSWAAQNGRTGIIELLLQNGIAITEADRGGRQPLSRASEKAHKATVRLLLEKGADVNASDTDGQTPLHWASRNGHEATARLLIEKGADVNVSDKDGQTPLSWALEKGHEATAMLLIEKGADVNASDKDGQTPLYWASRNGHEATARLLLEKGADVNVPDTSGWTPLSIASNNTHEAMARLLIEHRGVQPALFAPPDSGYASTSAMKSGCHVGSERGDQLAVRSAQEPADKDIDETGSEYSSASSTTFSRQQSYISELADALSRETQSLYVDEETQTRVSRTLPQLLKAFALKIGHHAPTQMHRDTMTFVHRHRREIAAVFTDIGFKKEEENIEESTPDSNAMGMEERVSRWLRDDSLEEAGQEEEHQMRSSSTNPTPPAIPDDQSASEPSKAPTPMDVEDAKDEDVPNDAPTPMSVEDTEDEGVPENWLNAYREFIFSTDAFKWLLARLRKEFHLVHTESNTIQVIGERIMSSLPTPHRISRKLPSHTCGARFDLKWDIFHFFKAQEYSKRPDEVLEGVITVTGSCLDAQAATCAQYMHQTWPLTGEVTLQLIKDVLRDGKGHSCELADGTELSAWISNSRLIAEANGVSASVAETGEQLAWLGAALTTSMQQSGLVYCTPIITGIVQNNASPSQLGRQSSIDLTCTIEFTIEEVPRAPSTVNGQCWHDIFRNPVVVRGYPIPQRVESSTGLEIPLNIMARLARSQQVDRFKDKVSIKGFSTMLVPTRQNQDILCWHLIYNKDGSRISYLDDFVDQEQHITHLKLENLENLRHVLGWCSKVRFNAGSTLADYPPVAHSGLPEPRKGGALTKTYVHRGQTIIDDSSCHLGAKDTPVQVPRDPYHVRLNWISTKFVLLWDERDKRGWLINGTSALLHVVRASLAHDATRFRSSWAFRSKDLQVSEGPFTANSSIDVLNIPENLNLALFRGDENSLLKSRVEHFCNVLEKLIDHQADIAGDYGVKLSNMPRMCLEGWDFEDLATRIDRLPSRAAKLEAGGKAWVDFTRAIQAVTLVGSGFGDIVQPNDPDICSDWAKLPKHKYYIATCVSDLSRVVKQHGFPDDGRIQLCDNLIWHTPKTIFGSCQCSGASRQGRCDPVQTVFPLALSSELSTESHHSDRQRLILEPAEDKGALIFGHSSNFSWIWGDTGYPQEGELREAASSSKAVEVDSDSLKDSGIGSSLAMSASESGSNTRFMRSPSDFHTDNRMPDSAASIGCKTYSRQLYEVGIICALWKELKAVRALFDSEHGNLKRIGSDDNQYALGKMANHMVVTACLPAGEYGTNSAASVASNMVRSFPALQFCLLVGIAGGAPSEQNDVRLGDVVVGIPKGRSSGVVQYDLGKDKESNVFEPTGRLQGPPRLLSSAISALRSVPNPPSDPLKPHLDKITKLVSEYRRPAQEDVLYETCTACRSSEKVCPGYHVRQRDPRPTTIHYGLIGSGNSVIKNATRRDELAREHGVLCFEMEAAGVVNTVPCLVIRGICDYCDVHKNDDWQNYAAATAAAYSKLLLGVVASKEARVNDDYLGNFHSTNPKTSAGSKRRWSEFKEE